MLEIMAVAPELEEEGGVEEEGVEDRCERELFQLRMLQVWQIS